MTVCDELLTSLREFEELEAIHEELDPSTGLLRPDSALAGTLELLLDPIAALQDDEVAEIAKDDDEETFTDDDVIEIVEDEGRFPLEAGTTMKDDAGVIAELENADSTLNILSVFSSPQATKNIKEQSGNILNKFILQISFFFTRCTDGLV